MWKWWAWAWCQMQMKGIIEPEESVPKKKKYEMHPSDGFWSSQNRQKQFISIILSFLTRSDKFYAMTLNQRKQWN